MNTNAGQSRAILYLFAFEHTLNVCVSFVLSFRPGTLVMFKGDDEKKYAVVQKYNSNERTAEINIISKEVRSSLFFSVEFFV